MARKNKARARKGQRVSQGESKGQRVDASKRASLSTIGLYTLGALVVGGGGTAFAYDVMRSLSEQDLARIGNGTPAIVQIHDPQCGLCRTLQKETRRALKTFDASAVNYLVANVRNTDGAAFATQMGVGHVTLLLFDGDGELVHVVNGVTPKDALADAFKRHLGLASHDGAV